MVKIRFVLGFSLYIFINSYLFRGVDCLRLSSNNDGEIETLEVSLEQFVENETEKLIGDNYTQCGILKDTGIEDRMDQLVALVTDATLTGEHSKQFQDELAQAINIDGLNSIVGGSDYKSLFRSKGLLDALEESNPNVIHFKKITERTYEELLKFSDDRTINSESYILSQMFTSAYEHSNKISSLETYRVEDWQNFLTHAVSTAVVLADLLSITPDFIEYLPIIGLGISQLKRAGQTANFIIHTVRELQNLMKQCKDFVENPRMCNLKTVLRSNESVRMYSHKGVDYLTKLATKLSDRFIHSASLGDGIKKEIAARAGYFLLSKYATQIKACIN